MRHGSLFSGIGGFDIAAEWMGWENVFHCEWNDFGQKTLKYYWPNAKSYGDIKQTDFTIYRGQIDVLSGGFPCQPYSVSGKRLGKEDDRHLWPEMLRAIREIQPRWVVGENVRGIISWGGGLVFDEVQSDLEAEGYEVLPFLLPAVAVDAPHRRDRVWFVAYSRYNTKGTAGNSYADERGKSSFIHKEGQKRECKAIFYTGYGNIQGDITNAYSEGRKEWIENTRSEDTEENKARVDNRAERFSDNGNATYTEGKRYEPLEKSKSEIVSASKEEGIYGRSSDGFIKHKSWADFPTQSPVCGRNDGIPGRLDGITFSKWRNESIKAYGNAVVPQVPFEIFKAIKKYDRADNLLER